MSDITQLERERDQARENLNHTLEEVNRKASTTAQDLLLPEQPIRRHPIPSLCGAMALGLAAGGSRLPAVAFGTLAVLGALIVQPFEL